MFYERNESGAIMDRYGLDIEMLRNIAHFLNFTLQYVKGPTGIMMHFTTYSIDDAI